MPIGKAMEEWSFGDLEANLKQADLVLDETFVVPSTGHHPLETRTAMAYWQNGKLYLHCSTQSVVRTVDAVARWVGIEPKDVVLICEYTGGGFGSKGGGAVSMAIPALLSKKANAPVMMRVSREEESYFGRARTNMAGRVKAGFAKDGRILALDLFIVQDNGPYGPMGDHRSAGNAASLIYQPAAMRWRAVNVLTNTPPRTQQRSPGPMQANGICEGVITKAAKQLGIDQVAIRRLNSPEGKATYGAPDAQGRRRHITSAFVKEALDRGVEQFRWHERAAAAGKRTGSKVRGVGVAVGPHGAGSIGFDGLMTIRPDGSLHVQSGVGNLGTHSVIDLARVAAEVLDVPWENVVVNWGDTSKGLPWTCLSVGSQTTHAMTRANHAAAMDAKRKLQEIARDRSRRIAGRLHRRRPARVPQEQSLERHDVFASRRARDRAWRPLRWSRAAWRHSRGDESRRGVARGQGRDGRGEGQLSSQRRHLFLRRGLCRSRGRCGNRRRDARRLPVGRRRRHGRESEQPDWPAEWRRVPRHRARIASEAGLRPALWSVARATLPPQQADHDPRSARQDARRRRWTLPIRKRRSARAAWANRRWARGSARC